MELPQQADRIADAFTELDTGRKQSVLGHLRSLKDQAALDNTVEQIIHNGGPEAELVGRIFNRPVASGNPGNVRSVSDKKLSPIQTKTGAAGSGGPADGSVPHEEPHTSRANPPRSGHPIETKADGENSATESTEDGRVVRGVK